MKKILFTPGIASVEALGSITRLVAIADEIKKRDKDFNILFRTAGREAAYAKKCGYQVAEGYKPEFDIKKLLMQQSISHPKFCVASLCDVMKLKNLISKEYVQNTFKEEMELVQKYKPDIIFGEFETVMPIVAKKMDIPYFSTGGTPNKKDFSCYGFSNKDGYKYTKNYNELLNSLDMKPIESVCELNQEYNSRKIFVPSIPELEELGDDSKYIYLGSTLPKNFMKSDFKFEKTRPLIYVYLSVSQIPQDIYKNVIADAFTGSEFDVIVTEGGSPRFKGSSDADTDNVHFLEMVPADKVMEKADIAIHHGGQNSLVQCIENRVPSIVFPGNHFERFFNAQKAAEIGCAINADMNNFNKEYLLKTCRELIKNKKMKDNLKIYSDKIKNYGGTAKAADYIMNY